MSRHDGVSCDVCMKGNFKGKRYKCLICYDYDLCSQCYDSGSVSGHHTVSHPIQCIITRMDMELYYGETPLGSTQAYSFTCPYCGLMGFSESTLVEHAHSNHSGSNQEVICPVCASNPMLRSNFIQEDLATHLAMEHRHSSRDMISFFGETGQRPVAVRRIPLPPSRSVPPRSQRRPQINLTSSGSTPSDPITEFLSHISGSRLPHNNESSRPKQSQLDKASSSSSSSSSSRLRHGQLPLQNLSSTTQPTSLGHSGTSPSDPNLASTSSSFLPFSFAYPRPQTIDTRGSSSGSSSHQYLLLPALFARSQRQDQIEKEELISARRAILTSSLILSSLKSDVATASAASV